MKAMQGQSSQPTEHPFPALLSVEWTRGNFWSGNKENYKAVVVWLSLALMRALLSVLVSVLKDIRKGWQELYEPVMFRKNMLSARG